MNKLQIIQHILGDNYTPIASFTGNQEFYCAKPKRRAWLSSFTLDEIISRARAHNVRVAIDLDLVQIDLFFTNN
jgi:hypothetical protein